MYRKSQIVPRRHLRQRMSGAATILWVDANGQQSCAANCVDASAYGLLIEAAQPIPVGTDVTVRIEAIEETFGAAVRQQRKYCGWYRIGLRLDTALGIGRPDPRPSATIKE